MNFINFKEYKPEEPAFGENALYIKDEANNDWYDIQSQLTKKHIFAYETATGIIRCISDDASKMYPVNLSVSEIDEIPDGFSIDGSWLYSDGSIVKAVI
ncbi:hypothetical protein [Enterobacter quasiroggenkampii]|uniref:hypothetical protein n=1 Tax=Enterobacter quasiroggenkampii TaxID=2497436 RepID=UPI0021CF723F|nr:hypothetical protein [Enterobacter quasiroggenkampii]MCU6406652.1 hypothetical protein [Enterobacter quasiroggenkampii]